MGAFIRATSIDELPQLFNVLNGDMSLVGPRPPLLYEAEKYQSWHLRRILEIRPGITGLWQVEGRSRTSFDDMVRLDLRYIRNCSPLLDLKILLKTVLGRAEARRCDLTHRRGIMVACAIATALVRRSRSPRFAPGPGVTRYVLVQSTTRVHPHSGIQCRGVDCRHHPFGVGANLARQGVIIVDDGSNDGTVAGCASVRI